MSNGRAGSKDLVSSGFFNAVGALPFIDKKAKIYNLGVQ
jgi:hypothetical protein